MSLPFPLPIDDTSGSNVWRFMNDSHIVIFGYLQRGLFFGTSKNCVQYTCSLTVWWHCFRPYYDYDYDGCWTVYPFRLFFSYHFCGDDNYNRFPMIRICWSSMSSCNSSSSSSSSSSSFILSALVSIYKTEHVWRSTIQGSPTHSNTQTLPNLLQYAIQTLVTYCWVSGNAFAMTQRTTDREKIR